MLAVVSNWHLYYSQHHACLIYYIGHMSTHVFDIFNELLDYRKQDIEICFSCMYLAWLHIHLDWIVVATSQLSCLTCWDRAAGSGHLQVCWSQLHFGVVSIPLDCGWYASWNIVYVDEKKIGPRTVPWGTSDKIGNQIQPVPLKTTSFLLFV